MSIWTDITARFWYVPCTKKVGSWLRRSHSMWSLGFASEPYLLEPGIHEQSYTWRKAVWQYSIRGDAATVITITRQCVHVWRRLQSQGLNTLVHFTLPTVIVCKTGKACYSMYVVGYPRYYMNTAVLSKILISTFNSFWKGFPLYPICNGIKTFSESGYKIIGSKMNSCLLNRTLSLVEYQTRVLEEHNHISPTVVLIVKCNYCLSVTPG